MQRALAGKTAWVSGLRRADSPSRATTPIVHDDLLRGVKKINPIATWTDEDVDHYKAIELLPDHPLDRARLRVDRLLAVHAPGAGGRGRPRRALVGQRQVGVRPARLDPRRRRSPSAGQADERRGRQARAAGSCAAASPRSSPSGTDSFDHDNQVLLKFHGIYQQDDRDVRRERTQQKLRPRLLVHGAGIGPRRQAHARAVAGPRSPGRPRRRHDAPHDAPGRAVPRRAQGRAARARRRHQPRPADDARRVRRRRAQHDGLAVARRAPGRHRAARRRHRGPLPPADRVLLGGVGRRREGVHRGARRRCRTAARRAASGRPSRSTATSTCRASSRSPWPGPATTTSTCSPTTSASCRS